MEEDDGSDGDELLDMNASIFSGRNWTAEEYSNVRSKISTILLETQMFSSSTLRYNKMSSLVIWLRKPCLNIKP
jgi:hypothetical protein